MFRLRFVLFWLDATPFQFLPTVQTEGSHLETPDLQASGVGVFSLVFSHDSTKFKGYFRDLFYHIPLDVFMCGRVHQLLKALWDIENSTIRVSNLKVYLG